MPQLIAPARTNLEGRRVVFLAGSIEMGKAEDWQSRLSTVLLAHAPPTGQEIIVANPRRLQWDASWRQSIDEPMFAEQVNWELDHLDRADLALFYFQPGTQSPITLMELGLQLARPDASSRIIVCCPERFWRRGNVEVACQRAGLPPPLERLEDLEAAAVAWLS